HAEADDACGTKYFHARRLLFLERIDIQTDVPAVRFQELADRGAPGGEGCADIRARHRGARPQAERFRGSRLFSDAQATPRLIRRHRRLDPEGERRWVLSSHRTAEMLRAWCADCRPRTSVLRRLL
ncbi:MAG TPA: hypothetical protein VD948_11915, partial [Rhodothermales bacterium]|nr:hypothetical protein [Rhodothermales bacterium]